MNPINFCKMHGLGNDFIVINGITESIPIEQLPIKTLANRHLGIGFDQLLLIQPSKIADIGCRIFNSDGSEAEQCGNGMRCVARFVQESGLISNKTLTIETKSGVIEVQIGTFDHIQVNMGKPTWQGTQSIQCEGSSFDLSILSLGNPHAILKVAAVKDFPVAEVGSQISTHSFFPQGTNVGFMEIINRQLIRLRTFERGAGETLACGSNSCAAVIAGIQAQWLDSKVQVELPVGNLQIEWPAKDKPVILTGPAEKVFEGVFSVKSKKSG